MVTTGTLRTWALELPGTHEEETWGAATFRVGKKVFWSRRPAPDILREEDGGGTASVKASKADQAELIAGDGATYGIASHVGRFGWVEVRLSRAHPVELRSVVLEAWRRTAGKRLQLALPDHLRALLPDR